jgi:uncharacterized Zn finger protein
MRRGELEARFERARRDVLRRYTITRQPGDDDGVARFDVRGGAQPYVVSVRVGWEAPAECTCPDGQRAKGGESGLCKHAIAVLLRTSELRFQLLDALL